MTIKEARKYVHCLESGCKWNYGPYELVRRNLRYIPYPQDRIHMIKGKVEDTLVHAENVPPKDISVLRLDTDFYTSTLIEMEVLFPKVG